MFTSRLFATSVRSFSTLPKAQVEQRVLNVVRNMKYGRASTTLQTNFTTDLKFDSLLKKDLINLLEKEFAVPVPADKITTVQSVVDFYAASPKARAALF